MRRAAALLLAFAPVAAAAVPVPFVGCPSDGQLGPQPGPPRTATPDLPAPDARRLAFYRAADGGGVLAPRGWRCFGTYGSNGEVLVVAPRRLGWRAVMDRRGLAGPAIQLDELSGGTSGRFAVARTVAPLFPAARAFVARVAAEGLDAPIPRRGAPTDRVRRRGPTEALYTTPAGRMGLGTASHLRPGPLPIDGIVRWQADGDHDLTMLHARLAPADRPLVARLIADLAARR